MMLARNNNAGLAEMGGGGPLSHFWANILPTKTYKNLNLNDCLGMFVLFLETHPQYPQ